MLRAVKHDSWLDVGGILFYPAADHGVVDMCHTFSPDLRWHISLPGEWLLDDRRRAPEAGATAIMRGGFPWPCSSIMSISRPMIQKKQHNFMSRRWAPRSSGKLAIMAIAWTYMDSR